MSDSTELGNYLPNRAGQQAAEMDRLIANLERTKARIEELERENKTLLNAIEQMVEAFCEALTDDNDTEECGGEKDD